MTWSAGCAGGPGSTSTRTGAGTPTPPGCCAPGTPVEVVSRLLGHASVTTTVEVYGHLSVEDARRALEQAGWFADRQRGAAVTRHRPGRRSRGDRRCSSGCWARSGPSSAADVLVFDAEDPVFGGGACRVESCRRPARGHGHVPGPSPAVGRRGPPGPGRCSPRRPIRGGTGSARTPQCRVTGCGYGSPAAGCVSCTASGGTAPGDPTCTGGWPTRRRSRRRRRRGLPDRVTAICGRRRRCRSATPTPTPGRPTGGPTSTSSSAGSTRSRSPRSEIIRLDGLGPQLRLEIQYALQCRHDQRTTKTLPGGGHGGGAGAGRHRRGVAARPDRGRLADRGSAARRRRDSTLRALLIYARRKVCGPRRRRRLGGRVRPRRLADAPPRVRRQPAARLHRRSRSRGCGAWSSGGCAGGSAPGSGWRPPAAGCAP